MNVLISTTQTYSIMQKIQAILSKPLIKNIKARQAMFYALLYTMAFTAAFQASQF